MGIDFEVWKSLSVQTLGQYPLVNEFGTEKGEIEDRITDQHQLHFGGEHASHVILTFV
jgi:hypothetical protein